jgi:DnaJ-class molecular chaperone
MFLKMFVLSHLRTLRFRKFSFRTHMSDYYTVLGISHQAESDAVAKAYRRSALTYNPECNPNHSDPRYLTRQFRLVSQAYVVLSNPKVRAIYDQFGEDGVRHGGTGTVGVPGGLDIDAINPDEVFRRFFGVDNPFQVIGDVSGVNNNQHSFYSADAAIDHNPPPAAAVRATLDITLEDVFLGATRVATWTNKSETTAGTLTETAAQSELSIPKGIKTGDFLTLKRKGNMKEGFSQGDVILSINVLPHDRFRREGDNLVVRAPISLSEALCGVTVTVTTIEGRQVPILIDEIVHPTYRRVIAGEGLPHYGQPGKRGDLVVECVTQFPTYLTAEQKSELRRILDSTS